jgi:hypothetical protein
MRRGTVPAVLVASLLTVAAAAAATTGFHFTDRITGAAINATQSAYVVHDSHFGNGAGLQTVKINSAGTGGTDRETSYFGNATLTSRGSFRIGAPNAQGIAPLTGSGRDVRGTGRAKGYTSTYTYRGTYDTKTGVFKVKLTGTYRH